MLEELLAWWIARWRELVPARWREGGIDRQPVVVAEPDLFDAPGRIALSLRQAGTTRRLGEVPASPGGGKSLAAMLGGIRPSAVFLRLPPGMLLGREVALPLAAERELARVLRFEMDRLTPFGADDLLYAAEVARRDRAASRLHLRLALVPRAAVEPALSALAGAGIAADGLEGDEQGGTLRRIALARAGRGGGHDALLARFMWGLAACLAAVVLVVPFLRQGAALRAADRQIALLRPTVAEAAAIRARITDATAGADVLETAERRTGDPLDTLAALTAALPDNTFLTDMSLVGRKLTLNGQSASAANLIGALSADPQLRDPSFVAPVTRLEATHTDLFSIKLDLAPPDTALLAPPPPATPPPATPSPGRAPR